VSTLGQQLALRADGRNWNALQYASLELRQEPDLCLEAVQQRLGWDWGLVGTGDFRRNGM